LPDRLQRYLLYPDSLAGFWGGENDEGESKGKRKKYENNKCGNVTRSTLEENRRPCKTVLYATTPSVSVRIHNTTKFQAASVTKKAKY